MGNTEWSLVHGKLHAFNYYTSVILSIYTVTSSKILSHVSVEEVLSVIKVK